MLQKIRQLIEKYWDILAYLVVGVATTAVSWGVYFVLYNPMRAAGVELAGTISNVLSWIAAVAFAFPANKVFVFRSTSWSTKTVLPELISFVSSRLASLGVETGILFLVDILHGNGNIWKIVANILVMIMNYAASKLIFRKK